MAVKKGFTAGAFDLLHAGHVLMLQEAANQCEHLTVFLQTDPTIDRPEKNQPIESLFERYTKLKAIAYVDEVITYQTEQDLYDFMRLYKWDVRIIGSDHEGKTFTGDNLNIKLYFNDRNHKFSTTNLRKRVYEAKKDN